MIFSCANLTEGFRNPDGRTKRVAERTKSSRDAGREGRVIAERHPSFLSGQRRRRSYITDIPIHHFSLQQAWIALHSYRKRLRGFVASASVNISHPALSRLFTHRRTGFLLKWGNWPPSSDLMNRIYKTGGEPYWLCSPSRTGVGHNR